jgi:plasmid stabilization system protein ParE
VTTLRILPEAEEDLAEAAAWYERKRTGLGVELVATVDRAFEQILDAPLSCGTWRDDRAYHRKLVTRFPYVIFFRIDARPGLRRAPRRAHPAMSTSAITTAARIAACAPSPPRASAGSLQDVQPHPVS